MSKELIAALTAYHFATGKPLPLGMPRWDGSHINTFLRLKDFFK